jgi:signal transduction histidine kinase
LAGRVAEKTKELAAANQDLMLAEDLLNASFDLAARLQDIQKAERQLVARVTYDRLGRSLSSIEMDLASLIRNLPSDEPSRMKAKSILRLVEETIESARLIATELRPGSPDPETR